MGLLEKQLCVLGAKCFYKVTKKVAFQGMENNIEVIIKAILGGESEEIKKILYLEVVSCTYKKAQGYATIFAYAVEERYITHCILREGKQHSQKGTPEFLRNGIPAVWEISGRKPLVRIDSGFDDKENIQVCNEERADYVIKRNLQKESQEEWLTYVRTNGERIKPRKEKEVYLGRRIMESKDYWIKWN